jgi:hypothetical protein
MAATPYQVGRAEALLTWMEDAARRGEEDEFRRAEESLVATLAIINGTAVDQATPEVVVSARTAADPRDAPQRDSANASQGSEDFKQRTAVFELTIRELQAQLDDARRTMEEMADNVSRFSTAQAPTMHAEALAMVERLDRNRKSPQDKVLSDSARQHLKAGEEQMRKGNATGAIFHFSQISGIYYRSQRRVTQ